MNPVISVIVATYNQEDTIGRALDSVLMQQCKVALEIVIGEDCSTDGTLDICRQYEALHPDIVRVIANDTNKGVVKNYYDCILASKGRYIADCAGDDFWTDPLKLQKELDMIEEHPEVNIVFTRWNWYDEETGTAKPCLPPPFDGQIVKGEKMLEHIITQTEMNVFHLSSSLYRADVVRRAYSDYPDLFKGKDLVTEDIQLTFMMAKNGDVAYLPDFTMNYSIGRPSASQRYDHEKQFSFTSKVMQQCHTIANTFNMHSELLTKNFADRMFAVYMHAFRANDDKLYQEAIQKEKEWGIEKTWKINLAVLVMSNKALWTLCLYLRRIFINVKQALL